MLNFDFFSSFFIALLFVTSGLLLIRRWRQVKDATLWGLIVSMFLLGGAYFVFTYNAYHELSNAPYRYWLRAFNVNLAVSIIWLSTQRYNMSKAQTINKVSDRDKSIEILKDAMEQHD